MCGRKSLLSFCLFALSVLWFVPRFVGQVHAQQSPSFTALINGVTQEGDGYKIDYVVDPAAWETNIIDHIDITVYPLLNTSIETWSRTEIGQDETIIIPADIFPNSDRLYETYRLEMALIKDGQIALSDSGQPFLLIHPFIHRASSPSPSPSNNTIVSSADTDIESTPDNSETAATETSPVEPVETEVDESADCNTLCQFQTRLDEQPVLRYLLFGALGLLLISLILGAVQLIQSRRKQQARPRLRRSPVHSNTVIYSEEVVSHEPDPYTQPSTTQFEHDPLDDIYDNTPEYDPSNPSNPANPATLYEQASITEQAAIVEVIPPQVEPEPIAPSYTQSASAQLELIGARDVTLIGTRYDVRSFPFTIGREDAELVIDDGRISRNHARLTFDGTTFHITDLGSSNGVYVGGQKITPNTLKPLSTNEAVKISLGSQHHFVFWGYV